MTSNEGAWIMVTHLIAEIVRRVSSSRCSSVRRSCRKPASIRSLPSVKLFPVARNVRHDSPLITRHGKASCSYKRINVIRVSFWIAQFTPYHTNVMRGIMHTWEVLLCQVIYSCHCSWIFVLSRYPCGSVVYIADMAEKSIMEKCLVGLTNDNEKEDNNSSLDKLFLLQVFDIVKDGSLRCTASHRELMANN